MTQTVIDVSPENSVIRLKNAVDDSLMKFSIFTPSRPAGESPTGVKSVRFSGSLNSQ